MRPPFSLTAAVLAAALTGGTALAQGIDPANRPVAEVRITGLDEVPEQLVRNQIRTRPGDPYDAETVQDDIVRITHLGRFGGVTASVTPQDDGSVTLTYQLQEQPLLTDVRIAGNKEVSRRKLLERVLLRAGDPVDPFLIDQAKQQLLDAYHSRGYFVADISVDEQALEDRRELVFQIREGPKVRIRGITFEGNERYSRDELRSRIDSRARTTPLLFWKDNKLDRDQLELDAASIRQFYQERGYLDAQVGREIQLAPNQKDAVVNFVISEGPQYRVGTVRVEFEGEAPGVTPGASGRKFQEEQVRRTVPLVAGGVYSAERVRDSVEAVQNLYGRLGYIDTRADVVRLFDEDEPVVDVVLQVTQGEPSTVGKVIITGNDLTKNNVILREVRGMNPGRRFDRTGIDYTRTRLQQSPLFEDATISVLDPNEDDGTRDVLIEVKEQRTGSVSFGAAVSSDAGILGAIDYTQKNFDITDTPDSFGEFITGRAFRGAGQTFNISLQPGTEVSRYAVSFREPYLLESDYSLNSSLAYFTRARQDYDEARGQGSLGFGRRFGDVWAANVTGRGEYVNIHDIEDDAPVDVFDVEGDSILTEIAFTLTRSTVDSIIEPSRGSKLSLSLGRAGLLGGDYDFTRVSAGYDKFWTLSRDFLDRPSVLWFRIEAGHIIEADEAPVFERYYAGGHSSFRGFAFRGVGPVGIRNDTGELGDDPVGGDWILLSTIQYEVPLVDQYLRGVVFTDMGTVTETIGSGFDDWRVSVGTGIRVRIPFLGSAPLGLDFAIPLLKQDTDDVRLISFNLSLPLR